MRAFVKRRRTHTARSTNTSASKSSFPLVAHIVVCAHLISGRERASAWPSVRHDVVRLWYTHVAVVVLGTNLLEVATVEYSQR